MLHRRGDHDRPRGSVWIDEFDAGPQLAKRLGLRSRRLAQHDEVVRLLERAGRRRDPREESQPENAVDLVLVAHAAIERLGKEGERKPDHGTEQEAEDGVPLRSWASLGGMVRRLQHAGDTCHEPANGCELTLLLEERGIEGRRALAMGGERLQSHLQ